MQTLKLTKKYEKYPEYKDSDALWLGEIPNAWEAKKLQYLFEIKKRIAGKIGPDILSITQRGIKIKNTESNDGQLSSDYSKYQIVEKDDFAMNHMDLLTGFVDISQYDGVISPDYRVFSLRSRDNSDRYFLYLLQIGYLLRIFYAHGRGAAQFGRWRLPASEFKAFIFPVPSSNEQKNIVRYLNEKTSSIDQIIEKKQKQIELLREKRTATISHVITKGLDPKIELAESNIEWIGKTPKGWMVDKLKRVSEINKNTLSENTDPGFSFKYFDIGSVDEEEVSNIEREITFEKAPSRARRIVNVGDSIIATVRTYLKAIAYFDKLDTNTIASTGFAVLTPKEILIPKYLFYYLQSDRFINQVIIKSKGIGYPAITPFDLGSLEVVYPDKASQRLAIDYLDRNISIFNLAIENIEKSITLLKEFKSSLMFNVVTGKIKV